MDPAILKMAIVTLVALNSYVGVLAVFGWPGERPPRLHE